MKLTIDNSKKLKKADLSIALLLIVGILAVANFFSYQIFYRWDLTETKSYSISDISRRTVGELDDIVNIKAYFSKNLPNQLLSLKQEVADILDEYQNYSNGNIRVEFIDPSDSEELQAELYSLGIPQLTFEVYEKDKAQLVRGYMGLTIGYADKTEVIPAIKQTTSDLEYQLTTAIKKVTASDMAVVGYVSSHDSLNPEETLRAAIESLGEIYMVKPVDLSTQGEISYDIDTLIFFGPKGEFSDEELRKIDSFVMRGGSLLVLMDGVTVGRGLVASPNPSNLNDLLSSYGITINQDLIADYRNGMASFSQGFITFSTNYPYWPKITSDGFNRENSAVSGLESVILPWASSIEINPEKLQDFNITNLAYTTDDAWRVAGNADITPNGSMAPQGEQKRYNLAVMVDAPLASAYSSDEAQEQPAGANGKLIIIGDSDFINDGFQANNPDNLVFFQNIVDTLSLDSDLINIRSKEISSRPITEDLSDSARAAIRYLNIFGMTAIIVFFGLLRYYLRRKPKFTDGL